MNATSIRSSNIGPMARSAAGQPNKDRAGHKAKHEPVDYCKK
jgi:hypothetical protein